MKTAAIILCLALTGCAHHQAVLTWKASPTPSVIGYNVYRADVATPDKMKKLTKKPVQGLQYIDKKVRGGRSYVYAVTSVAGDGAESSQISRTRATIPKVKAHTPSITP